MENMRGAGFMILAMAAFTVEDAFIKIIAGSWPTGQIIATLGAGGALSFAVICTLQGQPLWSPAFRHPAVIWRNLAEGLGTFGFVTALSLVELSLASAILQASPILVTLGAALFLGESVGWRRWTAILMGLAGVLLILRPGLAGFQPAALFAVLGTLGLAARDIAIRRVPAGVTGAQLAWLAFLTLIPTGLLLMAVGGQAPGPFAGPALLPYLAALGLGTVGYYLIVQATRIGEISVVSPFRYTRLLFATVAGMAVFAERPDALTLFGGAIVVASGIYTLLREAQLRRSARAAQTTR